MKTEVAAGGIILRKHAPGWDVLVIRDLNDTLTFPKGIVEKGEELVEAARREILEEVGLSDITLLMTLPVIRYRYRQGTLISKIVHYFVFESDGMERLRIQREEGIREAEWLPLPLAIQRIGYIKTNKPLLLKVKQWISNRRPT